MYYYLTWWTYVRIARLKLNIISFAWVTADWFQYFDPDSVSSASITGCWAGSPCGPFTPRTINYVDGTKWYPHWYLSIYLSSYQYKHHCCKTEPQYHFLHMSRHPLIPIVWLWLGFYCLHCRKLSRIPMQSIHSKNNQLCRWNRIVPTLISINIFILLPGQGSLLQDWISISSPPHSLPPQDSNVFTLIRVWLPPSQSSEQAPYSVHSPQEQSTMKRDQDCTCAEFKFKQQ